MKLETISYEKVDELNHELHGHERDTLLFDGRTALESLALVAKAPRTFGAPIVVFDGPGIARQRIADASQGTLI